jgi:hypothetical protein
MGIALLTLSSLFQGFSAFGRKPIPRTEPQRPHAVRALRMARPSVERSSILPRPVSPVCTPRPSALRVVRVCDTHNPSGEMGRLVISGRMADVCAELDRLVAREAAQQAHATRH